jgi:hypothetical protein
MNLKNNILNQLKNDNALGKILIPTGTTQEYSPVIDLTAIGIELLDTKKIRSKITSLGYQIVNDDNKTKLVYSKMGDVEDYSASCFSEMHDNIKTSYKSILLLVIKNLKKQNNITPKEFEELNVAIKNIDKEVLRRDKKVKIRTNNQTEVDNS